MQNAEVPSGSGHVRAALFQNIRRAVQIRQQVPRNIAPYVRLDVQLYVYFQIQTARNICGGTQMLEQFQKLV